MIKNKSKHQPTQEPINKKGYTNNMGINLEKRFKKFIDSKRITMI
jgi:hypothetical protein